jgi:hypothetical protein
MSPRDKLQLNFTRDTATLVAFEVDPGVILEVFGDAESGNYEWRVVRPDGLVEQHSNVGYSEPGFALRDGLCAYIGPPEEPDFNAVDLRVDS